MKHPEYARRIKRLRGVLQLTQHTLAERLHVRPQVVASWEQGRRVPSATSYRRLADLAPPKEAWFFLNQIGVTKRLVRTKWQEGVTRRSPKNAKKLPRAVVSIRILEANNMPFLQIPLLRAGGPPTPRKLTPEDMESVIAIPAGVLPEKPDAYVGFRQRGDSMAPVLRDGFIVVVDQTMSDPTRLAGCMVAAWGKEGLLLRWLAAESPGREMLLRPRNPDYPTDRLDASDTNRILGKVVFWWGTHS